LNFDFDSTGKDISKDIRLNGRKFYLHHVPSYPHVEKTKLNCTIRPLIANDETTFKFKVFFDNVSDKELRQLLVVLSNGDNKNNLCHKIGKAKPLGLGSIKITVDDVFLRNINIPEFIENKYEAYNDYYSNGKWDVFETSEDVVDSYKKIANFDLTKGNTVSYPLAINHQAQNETKEASYQWFMGARAFPPNNAMDPKFRPLPKVTVKDLMDLTLPKLENKLV